MPPDDENSNDCQDTRPTLSLSRLARRSTKASKKVKTECSATTTKAESADSAKKRPKRKRKQPSAPIPSFHAERERLAQLFHSDDSDDEEPKKTRRKSKIPIPSFGTTVDSSDDEDLQVLLGDKPVFATKTLDADVLPPANPPLHKEGQASAVESLEPAPEILETVSTVTSPDRTKEDNLPQAAENMPPSAEALMHQSHSSDTTHADEKKRQASRTWTVSEILSLAEKLARDLNPFDVNKVYISLQNQIGDAWKTVKKAKVKEHVLKCLGPSEQDLFVAVDKVFSKTDLQTCTVKEVIATVQEQFSIPFAQATRKAIRNRLSDLLNNKVKPIVSVGDTVHEVSDEMVSDPDIGCNSHATGTNMSKEHHLAETTRAPRENVPSGKNLSPAEKCTAQVERETKRNEKASKPRAVRKLPKAPPKLAPGESKTDCSVPNQVSTGSVPARSRRTTRSQKSEKENASALSTLLKPAAPPKRGRKRKANCQLCNNCPCSTTAEASSRVSLDLAQTDGAIEKALIKRLQKMEKICEQYENQADTVRRTLKKHRREMYKKLEKDTESDKKSTANRFLPDADELGQVINGAETGASLSDERVSAAQKKMFASVPNSQPTLTQMLGGANEKSGGETNLNSQPTLTQMLGVHGAADEKSNGNGATCPLETIPENEPVDLFADGTSKTENGVNEEAVEPSDNEQSDSQEEDEILSVVGEQIPACRIEWKDGSEKDAADARSIWRAMLTNNYDSSLDEILPDASDDETDAMDGLLGLFDVSDYGQCSQSSTVELAMLSQRGKNLAQEIFQQVSDDPTRLSAFKRDCPSWRENILFAMHQRDGTETHDALKGVQDARKKLLEAKAVALKAFEQKEMVLDLFENALQSSLTRFPDFEGNDDFVLSQNAPENVSSIVQSGPAECGYGSQERDAQGEESIFAR